MKARGILSLVVVMLMGMSSFAQTGWNWPEDEAVMLKAKEKNALYSDLVTTKNYMEAKEPLVWLLNNAPNLNASIYINGAKIYKKIAIQASKDEALKPRYKEFRDSLFLMYDLRIKNFPADEGKALDRKASTMHQFLSKKKAYYPELLELFAKAFEVNGAKILTGNTVKYMDIVRKSKLAEIPLTDEEVIGIYTLITDILDVKEAAGEDVASTRKKIEQMLPQSVSLTCEKIEELFGPKVDADPTDIKIAKTMFDLLAGVGCLESPYLMKSALNVYAANKSYGMALIIGSKLKTAKKYSESIPYLKEAVEMTDDQSKKANIYMLIAQNYGKLGQKSRARVNAYSALKADATKTDAYVLIGNLYMNSFDDCKQSKSMIQDRAVFIAAYEMFKKAGDAKSMASAKKQFPSKEEAFTEDVKLGSVLTVGCWINEKVALKLRDE